MVIRRGIGAALWRRGAVAVALAAAVVVMVVGAGGCAAGARGPVTAEVRAETFDRYWGELDRHYPFFGISGVDWGRERERWRAAAVAAESPSEFYGVLAAMLSGLNDPHVMLRPAGDAEVVGRERASSPQVGLAWIGRRLYVRRWPADAKVVAGEGEGGPPGDGYPEVVSIDGVRPQRNMSPLVLRGPEHTAVDVVARWPDGATRTVRLTRPPAELGGSVAGAVAGWAEPPEVVHPALMAGTVLEQTETLRREMAVRWDDGTMTWLSIAGGAPGEADAGGGGTGTVRAAVMTGDGGGGGGGGRGGVKAERRVWGDWLTTVDLGEVGYLRVSTLDYEDAAGGISLEKMTAAFDAAVNGLLEKRAIILDLRYNGGGRPKSLAAMAGRLVTRRTELSSPERRFMGVVPYRYATRIDPREPVYRGALVVLINEETGSAAEHLASLLQREGRAKVVGERSTGAEALVEIVRGPDGSELRYGWLRFVDEDGDGIQGVGVVPDVEVGLSIERVREAGYAAAVAEVERRQFVEACELVGVDGEGVLGGR